MERLVWPALGWAFLALVVLVARPNRLVLLLSGSVDWRWIVAFTAAALFLGFAIAALHDWSIRQPASRFAVFAVIVGWAWFLFAGGGGLGLLLLRGLWPPTNGWFALLSGVAACPLIKRLSSNAGHSRISGWHQFGAAVALVGIGRLALNIWPQTQPL